MSNSLCSRPNGTATFHLTNGGDLSLHKMVTKILQWSFLVITWTADYHPYTLDSLVYFGVGKGEQGRKTEW